MPHWNLQYEKGTAFDPQVGACLMSGPAYFSGWDGLCDWPT